MICSEYSQKIEEEKQGEKGKAEKKAKGITAAPRDRMIKADQVNTK